MRILCAALVLLLALPVRAAEDAITVTAVRDPVNKSYRRIVAGMELFERRRHLAPDAELRFKLLPRHRGTRMDDVEVAVVGDSFQTPVAVAPDRTFALARDQRALQEDASVQPNRKAMTMTWRAEIRSRGVPAGMRRLGDLRLECEVGMASGLISNYPAGLFGWFASRFEGPEYCHQAEPRYLFFAERPIFGVTLVSGARREALPAGRLWAGATRNPEWKAGLPYCDCEVLLERTYFLPLGDRSWPDDTLIEFDYMEDPA